MTDYESAAGLVESTPGVCDALDRMGMHILAGFCEDIGPTITTLLSELERVGKERDEALERAHYADGTAELAMKHRGAAEALVAEALQVLEPFAAFADISLTAKQRYFLQLLVCPEGDDHPENYGPHFRAARAFIDRAKES